MNARRSQCITRKFLSSIMRARRHCLVMSGVVRRRQCCEASDNVQWQPSERLAGRAIVDVHGLCGHGSVVCSPGGKHVASQ